MNDNNFGCKLCEIRQKRNISQMELASKLGISRQAISKWELGIVSPQVKMLYEIAKILKVKPADLL